MIATARIGYIVHAFPVVSETFLINELRAMEHHGFDVSVFTLTRRRDRVAHGALSKLAATRFGPFDRGIRGFGSHLRAHWTCLRLHRTRYLALVGTDVAGPFRRILSGPSSTTWRRVRKRIRLFGASVRVADQARRGNIDHLHAYFAGKPLEVAERVRSLSGLPYSFSVHAKDLYTEKPERLREGIRHARFVVACHGHAYGRLVEIADSGSKEKIRQVRHGIDTGLFRHLPDLPRPSYRVLAVGRLTEKKGFDTLVQACAVLKDRHPDLSCTIIGDGRLRGRLQRLVRDLDVERQVQLRGFVPQEQLLEWYRKSTLLAAPSRVLPSGNRDGIANVVLEAMATGTPVVTTSAGNLSGVVENGRSGLVVAEDDVGALATAIQAILDSPELAARLGEAGAREAAKMDFRETNVPLVDRFRRRAHPRIRARIKQTADQAWGDERFLRRAERRLGTRPARVAEREEIIARGIEPGLGPNAWRRDLDLMIRRRLWDEVYKYGRLDRMHALPADRTDVTNCRILDLACGRGGLGVVMRARGADVVSVDLRHRNCRMTRARGGRYGLDMPTAVARAEELPFAPDTFDVVFMLELLEHVQDPARLLEEAARVCRPGGRCWVTVVNRLAHYDPHFRLWGVNFLPRATADRYVALRGRAKTSSRDQQALADMHYFTYSSFVALARAIGFEVVDPDIPSNPWLRLLHRLGRRASIGFNTTTLMLVPKTTASPAITAA